MEEFLGNKKESGVNRIIGVDSEKEKEILEYFKDVFEGHKPEIKEKLKSPEQKEVISRINKEVGIFLDNYGIDSIDIPQENIHLIDESQFTKEELEEIHKKYKTSNAFFSASKQAIVILKSDENKLSFYGSIVHEILHVQGFYSYQKNKEGRSDIILINEDTDEELSMNIRRSGFSIGSVDGRELFLKDLNESIITELEIRFEREFMEKWPELQDEIKDRKNNIKYYMENVDEPDSKKQEEIASIDIDENDGYSIKSYAYHNERKEFNLLVDELYNKNKDQFDSREEVFELFVKATMNGRLMTVARLIEKTFGKGTFRMISERTSDKM